MARTSSGPALLVRPRQQDRSVLTRANGLFRGYHVRAGLPDATAELVRDSGKPYLVDPETYIFTLDPKRLLDLKKEHQPPILRRGALALANGYGAPFRDVVGTRRLQLEDFANPVVARECVERVLTYQRSKLTMQLSLFDPYYEKYRLWDDPEPSPAESGRPPLVLVPPYFYFKDSIDAWLDLNVELGRHALAARREGDLVYPILLFPGKLLEHADIVDAVASRYLAEPFDGFLLWPNDFVEEREPEGRLKGLARLVEKLADAGRRVSKLYGGYLSALLSLRGLRGFSCGLGYGNKKNAFAYGGGGGGRKVAQRFYIQGLHQAFEFDQATSILDGCADLRCSCPVCQDVYGTRMDHFSQMLGGGQCELHFLHARRDELRDVGHADAHQLASDLRRSAARFDQAGLDVGFLDAWARLVA
jgi:hypothetical protein